MFNRLTAARIKSAEEALISGRLGEALDIVLGLDDADSRRAQEIRVELARRFLNQGQEKLISQHFQEALVDFENAKRCGAPASAVEEWRQRAKVAMNENARANHLKSEAIKEARQKLTTGSIIGAMDALARSPVQDVDQAAIADEIQRQGLRASEEIEAAKLSIKNGHLDRAVQHLERAKRLHAKVDGLAELEKKVVESVIEQCRDAFCDGRLDRAEQELKLLSGLGESNPIRSEMESAIDLSRQAVDAMSRGHWDRSGILLARVSQLIPKAKWIAEARKSIEEAQSAKRALLEGPLGLLGGRSERNVAETISKEAVFKPKSPPIIARQVPIQSDAVSKRFFLRIDGVGSFLLLRGDRMSIGRSGGSQPADLELLSDLSERHAEIVRAGEDYFLISMAGVELAGRAVEHALLQDGDRIRLGPRVRLRFGKPSLRSSAAILDLTDGVRTTSECRRVILWNGPLLLGSTRECHIPIRSAQSTTILVDREGQIMLRPMGIGGAGAQLAIGQPAEFGELRLSLQDAARGSGIGRVIG